MQRVDGPGWVQFFKKGTGFGRDGTRCTRVWAGRKVFRSTTKNRWKISIHVVSIHTQVTNYRLIYFFCPLSKFICSAFFFSYCIQCFQFQVYIAETKRTVYILLKNLHLDSLNQKMYITCNNKDIDAYLYTISGFIYHLFMHQISLYILYEQNQFLFVISLCTFCTVYYQNRCVNIHFAYSSQKCPEPSNSRGV